VAFNCGLTIGLVCLI